MSSAPAFSSLLSYELATQEILLGSHRLQIQAIRDMNKTIDDLFTLLEKEGTPGLLEKLCPYFGVIWPSARALAGHIAALPENRLRGKQVLELGCGLAIPSLVAASRGAYAVATDFHPEVPRFLARNVQLNAVQGLTYIESDWMRTPSSLGSESLESDSLESDPLARDAPYDWIIASDILYERTYPGPVARALTRHAGPNTSILLADPGRPYLQEFADEMKNLGFEVETTIARSSGTDSSEIFMLLFSSGAASVR